MIDGVARQRLQQQQQSKALRDGIEKLTSAITLTGAVAPKPVLKNPATDVAEELRNLQKLIGGGNLTESLMKLSKSLDGFDLSENSLGRLQKLVADLSARLRLLAEIEAKLPKDIDLNFPEEVQVAGVVDVDTIKHLPPVSVSNLSAVSNQLKGLIASLQTAVIKAIQASKTEFPSQIHVGNEVHIAEFTDLLDGIEELKKGFNLLINKEAALVGFPDKTIPVEIQNWKVAQPVTNVSINPNRGTVMATAVTVSTSLTPLPGTALADRRSMTIYNNSASTTIFVGGANVTAASGIPVPAGTYGPSLDAGPRNIVYAVTSSSTADVRVLEMNDLVEGGDS